MQPIVDLRPLLKHFDTGVRGALAGLAVQTWHAAR